MSKKKPILRKQRTREHVLADLSVNHVERQALLCGYSMQEIIRDYGIDLVMHTYDDEGMFEPGCVLFQIKATDQLKVSSDEMTVSIVVELRDVRWWLSEPMPVILVVYDGRTDTAYWVHLQSVFDGKKTSTLKIQQKHKTIRLPATNKLDASAMQQIRTIKENTLVRLRQVTESET